jgi:hypothetical protein
MSADAATYPAAPATNMDLSRWRPVPMILMGVGLLIALIGGFSAPKSFGFAYLVAYIFFLSLCLGSLFLVLLHHLFDASWSVPIRRVAEHNACLLFPVMAVLWIPIGLLAPQLYPWMNIDPHADHALHAKEALLNKPAWYIISVALFVVWGFLAYRLRYWSRRQDETGAARCTYAMRFHAAWGIFAFAVTLTAAIILWSKSLEHQWFSTMYGVYYFAESVWTTLATMYVMVAILQRAGPLRPVITVRQVHDIGVLWFAFTVFYAYIHFSQYFIIWNGNMPEETFWYLKRENGTWWQFGMLLIFGHFFVPFLALMRIDAKLSLPVMIPLAGWAWLMHWVDVSFNIVPVHLPTGYSPGVFGMTLGCMALILGVLIFFWLRFFRAHPPFPLKDPRMLEALGLHHPQASSVAVAKYEGQQGVS